MKTKAEIKEILRDAVEEQTRLKGVPKRFEDVDLDAIGADSNEATIAKEIFDEGMDVDINVAFEDDKNDLPHPGMMG
jgi:hypothetical protein